MRQACDAAKEAFAKLPKLRRETAEHVAKTALDIGKKAAERMGDSHSGDTISALCMDTHHREAALRPLAATWEKIPAGVFKESNTGVPTVLLTIKA